MIAWVLILYIEAGPTTPLAIFPPNSDGLEACFKQREETLETMRQDVTLKCERFQMEPVTWNQAL